MHQSFCININIVIMDSLLTLTHAKEVSIVEKFMIMMKHQ